MTDANPLARATAHFAAAIAHARDWRYRQEVERERLNDMLGGTMTDDDPLTYEVTIVRNGGAIETINFGGYGLLHELLTHILEEVAEKGWLKEWPELPNPRLLRPDPSKESP